MWNLKPRHKRRNPNPSKFPRVLTVRISDEMDFSLGIAARKKLLLKSELIREILDDALRSGKYATRLEQLEKQ
jgi:hypothetical protein